MSLKVHLPGLAPIDVRRPTEGPREIRPFRFLPGPPNAVKRPYSGGGLARGRGLEDPSVIARMRAGQPGTQEWHKNRGKSVEPRPRTQKARPESPEWCRTFYRPRNLTEQGIVVMRALDPHREGEVFPLGIGTDPTVSIEDRERFLARRYTAMDLLMKGWAFEVAGKYVHVSRHEDRNAIKQAWLASLEGGNGPDAETVLQWMGVLRRPSWEQMFALAPSSLRTMVDHLDNFQAEGLVDSAMVPLCDGEVETWSLTKKGWGRVRDMVGLADEWGWGPRKPYKENREYHEQIVGDAVAYAIHEIALEGGRKPTQILLDRALRRLHVGESVVPDVRIGFEFAPRVETYYEIEVDGLGRDYRSSHHAAKLAEVSIFRSFSPRGADRGGSHVGIGR